MRIATVSQRLCLIKGGGAIDVHAASNGRFDTDPAMLYPRWREFAEWAASASLPDPQPFAPESLGSPSPAPRQVYGIGLNYSDHAAESGFARPDTSPPVFTKFPSCITGPYGKITLPPGGHTDGSRARGRDRPDRARRVPHLGMGLRSGLVGRAGHLRAEPADGRHAAAVQPGQVLSGLRAGRSLAGHAGRGA